jgi:hypothetical protein
VPVYFHSESYPTYIPAGSYPITYSRDQEGNLSINGQPWLEFRQNFQVSGKKFWIDLNSPNNPLGIPPIDLAHLAKGESCTTTHVYTAVDKFKCPEYEKPEDIFSWEPFF